MAFEKVTNCCAIGMTGNPIMILRTYCDNKKVIVASIIDGGVEYFRIWDLRKQGLVFSHRAGDLKYKGYAYFSAASLMNAAPKKSKERTRDVIKLINDWNKYDINEVSDCKKPQVQTELFPQQVETLQKSNKVYCFGDFRSCDSLKEQFEALGINTEETTFVVPNAIYYVDNMNCVGMTYCVPEEEFIRQGYRKIVGKPTKDKAYVEACNAGEFVRIRGFYNAQKDCLFAHDGSRTETTHFDRYIPLEEDEFSDMMRDSLDD